MSYEAIYDYTPLNQGDIAVRVGDKIHHIKDVGCGWVIGNNITTGETGHFPAEYIKAVTSWRKSFSKIRSVKTKNNDPENKQQTKNDYKLNNYSKVKNDISFKTEADTPGEIKTIDNPKSVNSESQPMKRWRKKLLKYSDGKNNRFKVLFGVLTGVVLGVAIFLAMYYSFHYDILVSSIITGVSTILLAVGLAISTRCRCIVLLVFPSLATGKGRAAFLSIITGLLLMGPITNITNNSNQVAISMACITELAYNQSQVLQDNLQEPVRSLREQIKRGVNEVKKFGEQLDKAFKVLQDGVGTAEKTVSDALNKAKNNCERSVNSGFRKCQSDARSIKAECMKALDPISMASTTVTNTVSQGVNSFVRGVSRVFGKKRRRRRSCSTKNCPALLKRSKRGVLGRVCDVFTIGDKICGGFESLGVCDIITLPGNLVNGIFSGIRSVLDAYANLFEVGVRNSGNIDSDANSSQSAAQIVDNIRSELTDKLDMAKFFITILTRIMSTSIVLLIINAFLYDKRYKSKLSFDNHYITRYFKEIDGKRRGEHKKSILPLKKNERKMYTDTRAMKMSVAEKGKCKIGIAQVLLHSVITIMVILFDYLLHFILYLLNKHGDVRLTFTGETNVNIQITGSGLFAQIFKILANDISIAQAYNSTINIDVCLPQPTEPDRSQIYSFAALYAVALFFVIMQGYGQRLLHAIAAYFYPEREQQRVNYLYRKILVKRKTFILEAKQLILSNSINDEEQEKSSSKLLKFFKRLPCCGSSSVQTCTNCEDVIENIMPCKKKDCKAVYCEECFTELGRNCPLCSGGQENDIEEVMALDNNIELKGK